MTEAAERNETPDFGALTGIRSSKRNFYPEYRHTAERLERAIRALDSISWALVRTVEGPRPVLEAVVRAARDHMRSQWTTLVVRPGALPESRPRFLVLDPRDQVLDRVEHLPPLIAAELERLRTEAWTDGGQVSGPWMRVPMRLDGEPVGGLAGLIDHRPTAEPAELSVLRILANQAAVAMHNSSMYQASMQLRTRTEQLYDEAARHSRELAARSAQLEATQRELLVARERELLDTERHRIARELHDSVTQQVLTAGMVVDVCRAELSDAGPATSEVVERLAAARELNRDAVVQLRSAIYALHHDDAGEDHQSLPQLLQQLARRHRADLHVAVRVEGVRVALSGAVEQSLARVAGEALFNVARHARASRVIVRLAFCSRPGPSVRLSVADDGEGDPSELRRRLRVELANDVDDHRGLANMAFRARELGGTFAVRRARLGGVRVEVVVPLSDPADIERAGTAPAQSAAAEAGAAAAPWSADPKERSGES